MSQRPPFASADQPARRDFGISHIKLAQRHVPISGRDIALMPFCALVEFTRADVPPKANFLVVAPLSGHFPFLLRDLILGLLADYRVYVTDWVNVRHVPAGLGAFGLATNISYVADIIRQLAPGLNVIATCQAGVPALVATAVLAGDRDPHTPAALVLMGAPIDPLANPTRVVRLLRSRPISWFEDKLIAMVPHYFAGAGRPVYPAALHLISLWAYVTRRLTEGGEIASKLLFDDGDDPVRFPFLELYTSIMDLDAEYFLENTKAVFQDCLLREGAFCFQGEPVDLGAIDQTALLTVEGERDDIAAPGQTWAAHGLCRSLPDRLRRHVTVPGSGHFSLFYGDRWRNRVLPVIREFATPKPTPSSPK